MKRNPGVGDIVRPILATGAAFVAARALGGLLGRVGLSAVLGKALGAAGLIGLAIYLGRSGATTGLRGMVAQNQAPLIAGAGLALVDLAVRRFLPSAVAVGPTEAAAPPAAGSYYTTPLLGAYIDVSDAGSPYDSMMGAYVREPVLGEYVQEPMLGGGMGYPEGVDPGDQGSIERTIDIAEAAAGVGGAEVYEAAAGTVYQAAAGGLGRFANDRGWGPQLRARSTIEPVSPANPITKMLPRAIPIHESVSTPEGRGYAGGLFARHLFSGMMSG